VQAGVALELARRQGATLFELRAALDDFELRGQPAREPLVDVIRPRQRLAGTGPGPGRIG
jgi:hypothetical protein